MENKSLHISIIGNNRIPSVKLRVPGAHLKLYALGLLFLPFLLGITGVELGRRYLAPEVRQIAALAPENETTPPTEKTVEEALSQAGTAEAKTRLLSDELKKIRKYEAQLQKRAAALDSIIAQAGRLEFDFENTGSESSANTTGSSGGSRSTLAEKRRRNKPGIGGGDEPRSPLYRVRPARKSPAKTDEKVSFRIDDIDRQLRRLSAIPVGIPVQGKLSSGYGYRYGSSVGRVHLHSGLDVSIDPMNPAVATADGLVINAGPKGAYGQCVIIQHARGIETLYAHLARVTVKPGDKVSRGQKIGLTGNSGRSTGPHLHYEVRIDGVAKDPAPFVEMAKSFRSL